MLRAWADHDASTFRAFSGTAARFGVDVTSAAVLDLGCGANAPMSVILHSRGADVTGVDFRLGHRWGLGFKPGRYWQYVREAGPLKTARKIAGEWVYDRQYFNHLSASIGVPLTELGLDLCAMDAGCLGFHDESFDVVHSNATWEHLPDVQRATTEVARVLRPGGFAYIEIHLFPSLSGGHDLPWIVPGCTDLNGHLPWRHLRDPHWTPPVFLNRLRESDYYRIFAATREVEIVDWIIEFVEGEALLTDAMLRDLPAYSRTELTRRSIIAVLRKRS